MSKKQQGALGELSAVVRQPLRYWVDLGPLYKNLPHEQIVEAAILTSGRIVVMTTAGDSLWFEKDGRSPKGSFIYEKIA